MKLKGSRRRGRDKRERERKGERASEREREGGRKTSLTSWFDDSYVDNRVLDL